MALFSIGAPLPVRCFSAQPQYTITQELLRTLQSQIDSLPGPIPLYKLPEWVFRVYSINGQS